MTSAAGTQPRRLSHPSAACSNPLGRPEPLDPASVGTRLALKGRLHLRLSFSRAFGTHGRAY